DCFARPLVGVFDILPRHFQIILSINLDSSREPKTLSSSGQSQKAEVVGSETQNAQKTRHKNAIISEMLFKEIYKRPILDSSAIRIIHIGRSRGATWRKTRSRRSRELVGDARRRAASTRRIRSSPRARTCTTLRGIVASSSGELPIRSVSVVVEVAEYTWASTERSKTSATTP